MMNASQIYTNDTLATSRKPAAKSALKKITPPDCKDLRILILCISILFTLLGCEKQDIESSSPSDITSSTKTVVTQESLLAIGTSFRQSFLFIPPHILAKQKPEPSSHIPPPTIFTAKLPSMASPSPSLPPIRWHHRHAWQRYRD